MLHVPRPRFDLKRIRSITPLLGQEYLPMVGTILTWAAIAAAVGHADAVRLLAGLMLMRSARVFTKVNTNFALKQRQGGDRRLYGKAVRKALKIQAVSFAIAATILAALIAAAAAVGEPRTAWFAAIAGAALPVSYLRAASGPKQKAVRRSAISWSGLVLVGLAILVEAGPVGVAIAVAAREWVAFAVTLLVSPPVTIRPDKPPVETPITSHEVAAVTAVVSRHRFAYAIGKSLLGFLPFGNIVARTARGFGLHRRVSHWTVRNWRPIALIAAVSFVASMALPLALASPATMVVAASLMRLSAAAGSVLAWWRFADPDAVLEDEDDDDD